MDRQGGDHTAGDVGEHWLNGRAAGTQNTRGQTDTAQQWDGRDGGAAFLENHRQFDGSEVASGVRCRKFRPAQVDDRLPQRAPAFRIHHRLAGGVGLALGAQDVAHGVAQRQLLRSQSDIHKTPNIIKIVN